MTNKLTPYDFDLFHFPFENFNSLMNFRNPMSADVVENENELKVIVDLPGIKKNNIKITLENEFLTISASNKSESEEKSPEGNYIHRERKIGEYKRSFRIPKNVCKEDIKAKFEDGTLTLTILKNTKKEDLAQNIDID